MSLYAGIDAGTQSLKVVVYDAATKQVIASASECLELASRDDGSREQNPADWIQALRDCFARIDAGVRSRIVALAVSGQQHGLVPVDADGNVLAPAKLWCDTSTSLECDEIMDAAGGAFRCIELAGNPIPPGYTASKLPWTRKHRPDAYAKLVTILLPHDYLNFVLTGKRFCEWGDASGTGWLDVRTRRWSKELLHATDAQRDLVACLPPIVEPDAMFDVDPVIAAQLGLPATTKVATGGGDNMMAAWGTGAVSPGRLVMSLGTSGTLFAYSDAPVISATGEWAAFCSSSGGWLPLICTMNCTVATEQVAKLCGFSVRDGDAHLATTMPGASGLTMLPFFNGERTPDLPRARASLHGMDMINNDAAHLYRAAMEGATYCLKYGFDAFVRAGMVFERIVLTGGGAHSAAWRQMVADVFGLPVDVPRQAEGAAFGAALQALWATRRAAGEDIEPMVICRDHVDFDAAHSANPNPRNTNAYAAAYRRYLHYLDLERAEHAGSSHL
ncbi:MAG: xylulokinase [Proteobacteria bacterium]|nr:xylulokinase [Pseudomonadota bacterium]